MIRRLYTLITSVAKTAKVGWQFRDLPWWEPELPAL